MPPVHPARWLLALLLSVVTVALAAEPSRSRIDQIDGLAMPGLDRTRTLRVYLPPGYDEETARYPVLYLHDGQNLFDAATAFADEWGVDEAMDQLAAQGFKAIVVGIDNGGELRMRELSPWTNERFGPAQGDAYLRFLVEVVKPLIDQRYRTRPGAADTAIAGSSMGGLLSHYAIHARPDVYGRAGILSPSYWYAAEVGDYTRAHRLQPSARLYLYAGAAEGAEMVDGARAMAALLQASQPGPTPTLVITPGAKHNEAAWRAQFPQMVRWLFELPEPAPQSPRAQ